MKEGPKKGAKRAQKEGQKRGQKRGPKLYKMACFVVFLGVNSLKMAYFGGLRGPFWGHPGVPMAIQTPHFIPVHACLILEGLNPCFEGFGRPSKEVATLKTGYFGQSGGQNGHLVARIGPFLR